MSAETISGDTLPLVEKDGLGGHVPYVRQDTTPTTDYTSAEAVIIDLLRDLLEAFGEARDECRATRLALQEWINEGTPTHTQTDFIELATATRDRR